MYHIISAHFPDIALQGWSTSKVSSPVCIHSICISVIIQDITTTVYALESGNRQMRGESIRQILELDILLTERSRPFLQARIPELHVLHLYIWMGLSIVHSHAHP